MDGLRNSQLVSTGLWRQGLWLAGALQAASLLNYLANLLIGRWLAPADYGVYSALLSVAMLFSVLAQVNQVDLSERVSQLRAGGRVAQVRALLWQTLPVFLLMALLIIGVTWLARYPIASFLATPDSTAVVVVALFAVPGMGLPIVNGILQGLERFGAYAAVLGSWAALRLLFSLVLVGWFTTQAAGAVATLSLSALIAFGLGLFFLRDLAWEGKPGLAGGWQRPFPMPAALTSLGFALLVNLDVILVKRLFSPAEAGYYAAAATIGKIALYGPAAIVVLMFPKISYGRALGRDTIRLLRQSLFAVAAFCAAFTCLLWFNQEMILRLLFRSDYAPAAALLAPYALAMALLALVHVWAFYFLATGERRYGMGMLAGSAVQVVALHWLRPALPQVIMILIVIGLSLYLLAELLLWAADR